MERTSNHEMPDTAVLVSACARIHKYSICIDTWCNFKILDCFQFQFKVIIIRVIERNDLNLNFTRKVEELAFLCYAELCL